MKCGKTIHIEIIGLDGFVYYNLLLNISFAKPLEAMKSYFEWKDLLKLCNLQNMLKWDTYSEN